MAMAVALQITFILNIKYMVSTVYCFLLDLFMSIKRDFLNCFTHLWCSIVYVYIIVSLFYTDGH